MEERTSSLPDIKKCSWNPSRMKEPPLITSIHYDRGISSKVRPHSAEENARLIETLQCELKSYQSNLNQRGGDALFSQLNGKANGVHVNDPSRVFQKTFDANRVESLLTAAVSAENSRGEIAALNCKIDTLVSQSREARQLLENRDGRIEELTAQIHAANENEAKIRVLREQQEVLQSRASGFQVVAGQNTCLVERLQKNASDAEEKVKKLEDRLQSHLEEREASEQHAVASEKRYSEFVNTLLDIFALQPIEEDASGTEAALMLRINQAVQDITMMRGRIANLQETLENCDVEQKANRQTIGRLVAEVSKEQKNSGRFATDFDAVKLERDQVNHKRDELESEIQLLRERLQQSQVSLAAARGDMDSYEQRLGSVTSDAQARSAEMSRREADLQAMLHRVGSAFSIQQATEEDLVRTATSLTRQRNEQAETICALEEKLEDIRRQFQNQYGIRETAERSVDNLRRENEAMLVRLTAAEEALARQDVINESLRTDKTDYYKFLEEVASALRMDKISRDMGLDMNGQAIVARAEQLVRAEGDQVNSKSTQLYSLQRKYKRLKEQQESKELHLDLMRRKIASLEEGASGKHKVVQDRDDQFEKYQKTEKKLERTRQELADARVEIRELKSRLLSASDLKITTMEQSTELQKLNAEVGELERIKQKQNRRIQTLKDEIDVQERTSDHKLGVTSNTIGNLSSELKTTKASLDETRKREKTLLDLRHVICGMLGMDVESLAVPDYEIVRRLESLVQAQHSRFVAGDYMHSAAQDVNSALARAHIDTQLAAGAPFVYPTLSPRHSYAPRSPRRSPSPPRAVDPHKY